MKTTDIIAPIGTALSLPMMAVFSVTNHPDRSVAHALDFDLVAVAPTEAEAMRKLRLAVKHHVEFGLKHSFDSDVLQSAPEEFWKAVTPDTKLSIGEPINVCDRHMRTATKVITENEDYGSLTAA